MQVDSRVDPYGLKGVRFQKVKTYFQILVSNMSFKTKLAPLTTRMTRKSPRQGHVHSPLLSYNAALTRHCFISDHTNSQTYLSYVRLTTSE